ncbi:Sperm flagellar protein [Schistosoma japonicum]|uniref:Sperm flagellar protein n=1 Tax=Schistosoma japonicum TaxID=6182 RepID=A0A4Z2DCX3_SCHJA|nr:Sperm flagellar protein [Schistosoma japonicum]
MDDALLQDLYIWVDKIPLSRIKRNIARDFSDGVLMAEVMKYFFPKYVDVHNFPTCNSVESKRKNWQLLNWKVFKKLNFELSDDVIESLSIAKPGTIEKVLLLLRSRIERMVSDDKGKLYDYQPEADRYLHTRGVREDSKSPVNKSRNKRMGNSQFFSGIRSPSLDFPIRGPARAGVVRGHSPNGHLSMNDQKSKYTFTKSSEYVPRLYLEEKIQQCLTLNETVEILHAKLRKLESLLSLKDRKIEELQKKVNWFSLQRN